MNVPVTHNLKPFDASTHGKGLVSGPLTQSVRGAAGQYAKPAKTEHDQLVAKTRTWVAQTFFGTLLKQMRDSPFKSELFSGGQGGQAFAQLQDQHLAEHMTRGAGSKLVNGIVRRIEANAAYKKQQQPPPQPPSAVQPAGKADNRPDDRRHDDGKPKSPRSHAPTARRS
jgi:Rod binding domain-containing protein